MPHLVTLSFLVLCQDASGLLAQPPAARAERALATSSATDAFLRAAATPSATDELRSRGTEGGQLALATSANSGPFGSAAGTVGKAVSQGVSKAAAVAGVGGGYAANRTDADAGNFSIGDIVHKIGDAVTGIGEVAKTLKELSEPVPLGGHSQEEINRMLLQMVCMFAAAFLLGCIVDKLCPFGEPCVDRPPARVLFVLLASYVFLGLGLYEVLLSFNLSIKAMGFHINVTTRPGHAEPAAFTESMISMIQLLLETGSIVGAALVLLYAIVIPAMKLVLLFIGELWRNSEDPSRRSWARSSIIFVQEISKWACPDMFAYILLLFLFRNLGDGALVEAQAKLDIGFSYFSAFCVVSTVLSLSVRPPSMLQSADGLELETEKGTMGSVQGYWLIGAAFVLASCFGVCLFVGLRSPCLALRLHSDALFEPNGPLPTLVRPVVNALHLEDSVKADVSIIHCVQSLLHWVRGGEANSIMALVILGIFGIFFAAVDVVVLTLTAVRRGCGEQVELPGVARFLKHVSMLDVCVMGVIVVGFAGRIYREQGVELSFQRGLGLLAAAELAHYLLYWTVAAATKRA